MKKVMLEPGPAAVVWVGDSPHTLWAEDSLSCTKMVSVARRQESWEGLGVPLLHSIPPPFKSAPGPACWAQLYGGQG